MEILTEGELINGKSITSKLLSSEEHSALEFQNNRLVSPYKADKLQHDACKHWDLFYKRNETRFFKDRHWTTREFTDLLNNKCNPKILEIGCGVGNLVYPLIEEGLNCFIYACDFSPRAIQFVKNHKLYNESYIKAFQCDVTSNDLFSMIDLNSIDVVTLVFVLSAVPPKKFITVLENLNKVLKPGGIILFRDYGLYDMAQFRFKPGNKILDNFYARHDGTLSFYFSLEYLNDLVTKCGYQVAENYYVHRRTINKKENVDVPRIFVQGKYIKPLI